MDKNSKALCSDILVIGAGYVGLSTALAIKKAAPHLDIRIIDGATRQMMESDPRASAIAAAASRMLSQLGIWEKISDDAQPINEMIVTDSKLHDLVRPVFLTFEKPAKNQNGPNDLDDNEPFAHMLPNSSLIRELLISAENEGVHLEHGVFVDKLEMSPQFASITTKKNIRYQAKLLIAADGVRSRMRQAIGIKTMNWSYDQSAIVTTVEHERPHNGQAQEHFLPAGPFAILPLKGNCSSLVWTEKTSDAERILAMDSFDFEMELEMRFGHKLGEISVKNKPRAFPLGLTLAREFVRDRFALVGDAAHGIHPIAGQGLNLGFKDAAALAQTVVEADRLGLDFGSLNVLEGYQRWRRFDTTQMGITTDVLNRLFSNDNPIIRAARDFGLGVVERLPVVKNSLISQAASLSGPAPNLLQGKPI